MFPELDLTQTLYELGNMPSNELVLYIVENAAKIPKKQVNTRKQGFLDLRSSKHLYNAFYFRSGKSKRSLHSLQKLLQSK